MKKSCIYAIRGSSDTSHIVRLRLFRQNFVVHIMQLLKQKKTAYFVLSGMKLKYALFVTYFSILRVGHLFTWGNYICHLCILHDHTLHRHSQNKIYIKVTVS